MIWAHLKPMSSEKNLSEMWKSSSKILHKHVQWYLAKSSSEKISLRKNWLQFKFFLIFTCKILSQTNQNPNRLGKVASTNEWVTHSSAFEVNRDSEMA